MSGFLNKEARDKLLADLSVFMEHYMRSKGFLVWLRYALMATTQAQMLCNWRAFVTRNMGHAGDL
jgi:hypothetical protein